MSLLHKLSSLFTPPRDNRSERVTDYRLAAAALMVEMALMVGEESESERLKIMEMMTDRLELTPEDATQVFEDAKTHHAGSNQLLYYTKRIKDHYDQSEREQLIEMLWEVVYADGHEDIYEANLMRRLSGLLYIEDRVSGEIKKRVKSRLNIA